MNNRKPLWITLGALLGVLALSLAVALILRGRGETATVHRSAPDAPYPYSWTEKDGTIALELQSKGGTWVPGDSALVEAALGQVQGESTPVTLTPVAEGREDFSLLLREGEDTLAEVRLTVEVEGEPLSATITGHREVTYQGTLTGGEGTDYPYTLTSQGGVLLLRITDPGLSALLTDSETEPAESEDPTLYDPEGPEPERTPEEETPQPAETGEGPEPDYEADIFLEEPVDAPAGESEEERWTAASSDPLVARPVLVSLDGTGLTYRIGTEISGQAQLTFSSREANVTYTFQVKAQGEALTVTDRGQGEYEPPADTGIDLATVLEGLEPYVPTPAEGGTP